MRKRRTSVQSANGDICCPFSLHTKHTKAPVMTKNARSKTYVYMMRGGARNFHLEFLWPAAHFYTRRSAHALSGGGIAIPAGCGRQFAFHIRQQAANKLLIYENETLPC